MPPMTPMPVRSLTRFPQRERFSAAHKRMSPLAAARAWSHPGARRTRNRACRDSRHDDAQYVFLANDAAHFITGETLYMDEVLHHDLKSFNQLT